MLVDGIERVVAGDGSASKTPMLRAPTSGGRPVPEPPRIRCPGVIAKGLTNAQIADSLYLSIEYVKRTSGV